MVGMIGLLMLIYSLVDFFKIKALWSIIWFGYHWPFVAFVVIGGIFFFISMLHKVSNAPLAVALETFWGHYTGRIKKWGYRLFLPYFPFLWGYKEIEITMRNFDLKNVVIQHPSGDKITIEGSINWFPDYLTSKTELLANNLLYKKAANKKTRLVDYLKI